MRKWAYLKKMWNSVLLGRFQSCGVVLCVFQTISHCVCACMVFIVVRLAWVDLKKKSFYRIHDHTLVGIDENDDDDDDDDGDNDRSDGNDDDYDYENEKEHKTHIPS